jgi:hypothetical protein
VPRETVLNFDSKAQVPLIIEALLFWLKGVVLKLRYLYFDIVSDFDIRISDLCRFASTPVENVRQIGSFMQNKPNFPRFSPKNDDLTKKQTQTKPKRTQFILRV